MLTVPSPYNLRKMQAMDVTAVKEIDRLSFPTPARSGMFEHEIVDNDLAYYQVLEWQPDDQNIHLIGFSGYWLLGDEVHISTVAVHPDWRGLGLGEMLLLNMLYLAYRHPVNLVTLEVRPSNTAAQNLYKKYRFEVVGERIRYYRDTGEDALIMTLSPLDAPYRTFLDRQQKKLLARLAVEG